MLDLKNQERRETLRKIWADVLFLEIGEIEDGDNFYEGKASWESCHVISQMTSLY